MNKSSSFLLYLELRKKNFYLEVQKYKFKFKYE